MSTMISPEMSSSAACRPFAITSRSGRETTYVGDRWSITTWPTSFAIAGTQTAAFSIFWRAVAALVKLAAEAGFAFTAQEYEAAVKEVQRNWRFVPGKEDGKPVAMWHTFAVTFRLTD